MPSALHQAYGKYRDISLTREDFRYHYLLSVHKLRPLVWEELREFLPWARTAFATPSETVKEFTGHRRIPRYLAEWFRSGRNPLSSNDVVLERLIWKIDGWATRNMLRKGWIWDYVLETLAGPSLRADYGGELHIPDMRLPEVVISDFYFRTDGWRFENETYDQFERRCRREFSTWLDEYREFVGEEVSRAKRAGKLQKISGRPFELERVEWLAHWNFGATAAEIAETFCREKQTIEAGIRAIRASDYDLPVRKGRFG
jgi:hypothetical protein